jgi:hypothetical protein
LAGLFGLARTGNPVVDAGLSLLALTVALSALGFFGSLILAGFRARRSLQL